MAAGEALARSRRSEAGVSQVRTVPEHCTAQQCIPIRPEDGQMGLHPGESPVYSPAIAGRSVASAPIAISFMPAVPASHRSLSRELRVVSNAGDDGASSEVRARATSGTWSPRSDWAASHHDSAAASTPFASRTELYLAARTAQYRQWLIHDPGGALDERPLDVARRVRGLQPGASILLLADRPTPDRAALAAAHGIELRDAATGATITPATSTQSDARWAAWLEATYGLNATPELERVLVLLAGGADRSTHADVLVDEGIATQRTQAVRTLRTITKALAGETHLAPRLVAREAAVALEHLAQLRPLSSRPSCEVSLDRAIDAVAAQPSLILAAGLTAHEVTTLHAFADMHREAASREGGNVGAPRRAAVQERRRWMAGRIAASRGATATSIDAVADHLLATAAHAAHAVRDAQVEAFTHPRARLQAAILTCRATGLTEPLTRSAPLIAEITSAAAPTQPHLSATQELIAGLDDELARHGSRQISELLDAAS